MKSIALIVAAIITLNAAPVFAAGCKKACGSKQSVCKPPANPKNYPPPPPKPVVKFKRGK